MNLWDSEKNNCLPSDIGYSSGKKYYFKCKYGKDHSTLRSPSNITKNGTSDIMDCEICNSFATYLINLYGEDAIEKYWDFDKNNVDVFKVRKQTNKKIYIKCQENIAHGSYKTTGNHFSRGQRCPYCSGKSGLIMPEDSLGALHPKSLSVWVGDELCSPYSLAPQTHKKFLWKCHNEKHDNYMRSVSQSVRANFDCPICVQEQTESKIEQTVKNYFLSLGYNVLTEYNCNVIPINPKTNRKLPFDNEIPDLHLIVEVHGEQHYKICTWTRYSAERLGITPQEAFEYQQWKDEYKKSRAEELGYFYFAISYKDVNSGKHKKIVDDQIKCIMNMRNDCGG